MAHANTTVIDKMADIGLGFFRQLLCFGTSTPYGEAIAALTPTCRFMGAPCKPSDDEPTTRAQIDNLAADPASAYCIAVLGPNEPNDSDYPWGGAANLVKHMWWIADEMLAVSWPHRDGGLPPPLWGPALKRNFNNADDPNGHRYDDDIAAAGSATYTPPGGSAMTMNDVLAMIPNAGGPAGGLDHHQYDGDNSPGDRVNGKDSYGNVPPAITLSPVDGKCSRVDYEIGLIQQLAPDHAVKARSEFGHEIQGGDQPHALLDQETFLRCYVRGVYGCVYEVIDEGPNNPNGSGNWFGLYNLTTGPKPAYPLVKTICGYDSPGASFSGVAWFEPLSGNNPDQHVLVLKSESGGWDVYILWEARTSTDLVCAPGHSVVGMHKTSTDSYGNKHYSVNAGGATMTVLQVA